MRYGECFDSATVSDDGLEITFWHGDTPLASITGISGGGGGRDHQQRYRIGRHGA